MKFLRHALAWRQEYKRRKALAVNSKLTLKAKAEQKNTDIFHRAKATVQI